MAILVFKVVPGDKDGKLAFACNICEAASQPAAVYSPDELDKHAGEHGYGRYELDMAVQLKRRPENAGWRAVTRDGGKAYDENFAIGVNATSQEEVIAVVRELYGMIWYLATRLDSELPGQSSDTRKSVQGLIEDARRNAEIGIFRGNSGV
jgi:hypothetical protein